MDGAAVDRGGRRRRRGARRSAPQRLASLGDRAVIGPGGQTIADVTLNEAQSAALRADNDRQLDGDTDPPPATATEIAVMAEVSALQAGLPSGAVLRYPNGEIARLASCDLDPARLVEPAPGWEDRAGERARAAGLFDPPATR